MITNRLVALVDLAAAEAGSGKSHRGARRNPGLQKVSTWRVEAKCDDAALKAQSLPKAAAGSPTPGLAPGRGGRSGRIEATTGDGRKVARGQAELQSIDEMRSLTMGWRSWRSGTVEYCRGGEYLAVANGLCRAERETPHFSVPGINGCAE